MLRPRRAMTRFVGLFAVILWNGLVPGSAAQASRGAQEAGACCFPDGHCEYLVQAECAGNWMGEGSNCDPNPCPPPTGACCYPEGSCEVTLQEYCTGTWLGPETSCIPNLCPPPYGACCFPEGYCEMTLPWDCWFMWWGAGSTCEPSPCVGQNTGGCCDPQGNCHVMDQVLCELEMRWQFMGVGTSCEPSPCTGACCNLATGACTLMSGAECEGQPWEHQWLGFGAACAPNPCTDVIMRTCCDLVGGCRLSTRPDCAFPATWDSTQTSCAPNPCPQLPPGACCSHLGVCMMTNATDCPPSSIWFVNTPCSPDPCPALQPQTYLVCPDGGGDYTTIADAVNQVPSGSAIELCDAIFSGTGNYNIDLQGRALTIRSRSGNPSACIIDAQDAGPVIICQSGETPATILEGFTVTHASAHAWGSALWCYNGSSPAVRNCIFRLNSAYHGGAVGCNYSSSPTFTDCLFDRNTATDAGGAILFAQDSPTFRNCTFVGNRGARGGAIYFEMDASFTMENCIVAFNNGVAVFADGAVQTPSVSCTDVFGNSEGDWVHGLEGLGAGDGNQSDDPLFCNRPTGNYSLDAESPCAPDANAECGLIGVWPVACGGVIGACCEPGSACSLTLEADCAAPGVWHGEWTSCETNPCPIVSVPPMAGGEETGFLSAVPNPFRNSARLWYRLSETERVALRIFDAAGRVVWFRSPEKAGEGDRCIEWDGRSSEGTRVSPGVYFARLSAGDRAWTKTLICLE